VELSGKVEGLGVVYGDWRRGGRRGRDARQVLDRHQLELLEDMAHTLQRGPPYTQHTTLYLPFTKKRTLQEKSKLNSSPSSPILR
jgi:hypothetical protein